MTPDGSTVVVGAPGRNTAYVHDWDWDNGRWTQRSATLDGEAGDEAGTSVAISSNGRELVVGAPGGGKARAYVWTGSWERLGGDLAPAAGAGWSVAMSSEAATVTRTVVVGASSRGGQGADDTATVYDWYDGYGWVLAGKPLPGAAVAVSGDGTYVAVGSSDDDSAGVYKWGTPKPLPAASYYDFAGGSLKASNGLTATLHGAAKLGSDGVYLDGSSGTYVSLPGLALDAWTGTAFTIEVCADIPAGGGGKWARLFDFGPSEDVSMFLTASNDGSNTPTFGMTKGGYSAEDTVSHGESTAGQSACFAATSDFKLYKNGELLSDACTSDSEDACALTLADLDMKNANYYVGKSQYASDAYLDAVIRAVRISPVVLGVGDMLSSGSGGSGNVKTGSVVIIVPVVCGAVLLAAVVYAIARKRKTREKQAHRESSMPSVALETSTD